MISARDLTREAFACCQHVHSGICRACVTAAIISYGKQIQSEAAIIATEHICGCGDHGTEIARRIRVLEVT